MQKKKQTQTTQIFSTNHRLKIQFKDDNERVIRSFS